MSISFYMDAHVHSAITIALRFRGTDVLTSQEDGRSDYEDEELLDRAMQLKRTMFTMDCDFLRFGSMRQRTQHPFTGIVYAHALGVTIGQCINDLEMIAALMDANEMVGRIIRLPL